MLDLKSKYQEKNFQINRLILKSIKNLNLSLNEFLLIMYFINEKNSLDLEDIKETLGFSDEEVLNTYSDLVSKCLIETVVKRENGKVIETISLDMFFDKLILNSTSENKAKETDIFAKFESEFGRSLSPIEYETINNWINNGVKEETIISALKEAVLNGVTNLRYIDKIIYEWTKKSNIKDNEEYKELFDYDWLGANDE